MHAARTTAAGRPCPGIAGLGRLTTHVLDTAAGRPAGGVAFALYRCGGQRERLASGRTNADGRCDAPLLEGAAFSAGCYELEFDAAGYFGHARFLDRVVIRFTVDTPDQHYHVPLLLSPFGYTTYRGS